MQRAASDVMQSILLSAVIDALEAMKAARGACPTRCCATCRASIATHLRRPAQAGAGSRSRSVRAAFTQLLKEGYAVGPKQAIQQSRPMDRVPDEARGGVRNDRRGPPRGRAGAAATGRPGRGGQRRHRKSTCAVVIASAAKAVKPLTSSIRATAPCRWVPLQGAAGTQGGGGGGGWGGMGKEPTSPAPSSILVRRAVAEQHFKKDAGVDRHIAERFGKVREEVLRTKRRAGATRRKRWPRRSSSPTSSAATSSAARPGRSRRTAWRWSYASWRWQGLG